MTEIKIVKKKPIWPWILLILIVLGIAAYFIYNNPDLDTLNNGFDDGVTNEKVMDSKSNQIGADGAYRTDSYGGIYDEYKAFDESIRDSTRIAVDSSYTKKAFSNLTKLVVKQADKNDIEDSQALEDLRDYSVLITTISKTSSNSENFKNFKTLCDKIAAVLGNIQAKSYPSMQQEAANLKQIATKISISTPMANQQTDINDFLKKSREILKSMN